MRILFLICLATTLWAQEAPVISSEELVKAWRNSKKFTLEVAEAMPAEKYAFKATDAEMAFGALFSHIGAAQAFRFQQISGAKLPPGVMTPGKTKAEILSNLAASFDFVLSVIPKLSAEQLAKSYKVDWRERPEATGREILLNMFEHTAHHRAQAEVYLRLNGIAPPVYLF